MSKLTKFSRDFVKTCIEYKINRVSSIRDYDIVKDHESGKSIRQLAIKYEITPKAVFDIIHKHK